LKDPVASLRERVPYDLICNELKTLFGLGVGDDAFVGSSSTRAERYDRGHGDLPSVLVLGGQYSYTKNGPVQE
jgi:hypothetical protein